MTEGPTLTYEQGRIGMKVRIHSSRGSSFRGAIGLEYTIQQTYQNYFLLTGQLGTPNELVNYGVWPYHVYKSRKPLIVITED